MKNIGLIKWITSLRERDRFWVVMLIAVSALWGQNLILQEKITKLQQVMIVRQDSCNDQKIRIYIQPLTEIKYLRRLVDSLGEANLFTIKKDNQNVKIVTIPKK